MAAPGPLLEVSSMAGGDSDDGTALRFLDKKALKRQKEEEEEQAKVKRLNEEEEERRMKRINAKVCDDIPLTHEEHEAWKRWFVALPPLHRPLGRGRRGGRGNFPSLLPHAPLVAAAVACLQCWFSW